MSKSTKATKKTVTNDSRESSNTSAIAEFKNALSSAVQTRLQNDTAISDKSVEALRDYEKTMSHDVIVTVLLECKYNAANAIVRERANAYRNIYTLTRKDTNLARALASAMSLNHFTKALFLSAHALSKADKALSFQDAAKCCDASFVAKNDHDQLLVVTSNQATHNTISSQLSSSIQSLLNFNLIKESRNSNNQTVFTFVKSKLADKLIAHSIAI